MILRHTRVYGPGLSFERLQLNLARRIEYRSNANARIAHEMRGRVRVIVDAACRRRRSMLLWRPVVSGRGALISGFSARHAVGRDAPRW